MFLSFDSITGALGFVMGGWALSEQCFGLLEQIIQSFVIYFIDGVSKDVSTTHLGVTEF